MHSVKSLPALRRAVAPRAAGLSAALARSGRAAISASAPRDAAGPPVNAGAVRAPISATSPSPSPVAAPAAASAQPSAASPPPPPVVSKHVGDILVITVDCPGAKVRDRRRALSLWAHGGKFPPRTCAPAHVAVVARHHHRRAASGLCLSPVPRPRAGPVVHRLRNPQHPADRSTRWAPSRPSCCAQRWTTRSATRPSAASSSSPARRTTLWRARTSRYSARARTRAR